ncbi:MAG: hypothetical protein M3Q08_00130 [Pseudomonadota bacterium]|nr:hypothetical protein [Pseudomonadota bacterium]
MSITEREIWACAHEILRRYGDAASFHAAHRADELLEKSDIPGQRIWLRILRCIEQLENQVPTSDPLN